jgi:ornithine carbamoyltransferase
MKKLLNISDITSGDFNQILKFSKILNNEIEDVLIDKNIGLIFEKNSTRTRLSFQVGINQLSGNYIDIKLDELNLQRIESYEDTFEIMSCYLDCLVFRTTDHQKLKVAYEFFQKPIINALSDKSHPCQAISDLFTLDEYFGSIDNLKIIWMGDINNVLFSLAEAIQFLKNTTLEVFTNEDIYQKNRKNYENLKNINFHFKLNKKVLGSANCIMTDVFNSMNDKENKESLLSEYQVNQEVMSYTPESAVFMHCLPAKIGSEVTKEVIKGKQSIVMLQAKNRMVAQRGILKWLNI